VVVRDDLDVLPGWMRRALFATGVMNVLAAVVFSPPAGALRAIGGMPESEQPVYMATITLFVLLFGVAYLWLAVSGRAERFFIAVAAAGKLSFVTVLAWFWAGGTLPLRAFLAGTADLVFAVLFMAWLSGAWAATPHPTSASVTGR
jgi:hypothetical protein